MIVDIVVYLPDDRGPRELLKHKMLRIFYTGEIILAPRVYSLN